MGVSTVTAARILDGQLKGKSGTKHFISLEVRCKLYMFMTVTSCVIVSNEINSDNIWRRKSVNIFLET